MKYCQQDLHPQMTMSYLFSTTCFKEHKDRINKRCLDIYNQYVKGLQWSKRPEVKIERACHQNFLVYCRSMANRPFSEKTINHTCVRKNIHHFDPVCRDLLIKWEYTHHSVFVTIEKLITKHFFLLLTFLCLSIITVLTGCLVCFGICAAATQTRKRDYQLVEQEPEKDTELGEKMTVNEPLVIQQQLPQTFPNMGNQPQPPFYVIFPQPYSNVAGSYSSPMFVGNVPGTPQQAVTSEDKEQ